MREKANEDVRDIVAVMGHNKILNYDQVKIREEKGKLKKPVFTVENCGTDTVKMVGEEVVDNGADYVLAIVNNKTGEVEYRPAKLVNFSTVSSADMNILTGKSRRGAVDYASRFGIQSDIYAEKAKSLAEAFGSSRKKKMLTTGQKRKIEEETMDELNRTAFASTSVLDDKKDAKLGDLTQLNSVVSNVLPQWVDTTDPKGVYPVSLFVSDEELAEWKDACLQVLQKDYDSFQPDIVTKENPFPPMLRHFLGGVIKSAQQAAILCALGAYAYVCRSVAKGKLTRQAIDECPFPLGIVDSIRSRHIGGEMERKGNSNTRMINVAKAESTRLVAHTLAFAISVDPSNHFYPSLWSRYLCTPLPQIDKVMVALGAVRKEVPEQQKIRNGNSFYVLNGPPSEMKGPPRKKRR